MGFYDRPYSQEGYGQQQRPMMMGGRPSGKSVVMWLIIINVAVYVLDAILRTWIVSFAFRQVHLMGPLEYFGYFSTETAVLKGQVWRFLTFQFLHSTDGIGHLFMNMMVLFFFGPMVEQYLGSKRFLGFYLLCGVAGSLFYSLLLLTPLMSGGWIPMVGASAGIFGILLGASRVAPDTTVMLLFPPIPMKLKTMAWGVTGIAAIVVLSKGENSGGEAAHLGGAILGFVLIKQAHLLNIFDRLPGGVPKFKKSDDNRYEATLEKQRRQHADVDRILEKVQRDGLHSLTTTEKKTLQEATKKQRGEG